MLFYVPPATSFLTDFGPWYHKKLVDQVIRVFEKIKNKNYSNDLLIPVLFTKNFFLRLIRILKRKILCCYLVKILCTLKTNFLCPTIGKRERELERKPIKKIYIFV